MSAHHPPRRGLRLIAREGDTLDVRNGPEVDLRTVEDLGDYSFNDLGYVAFEAKFTDGSYAILVSNLVAVPQPSAGILLILGIAVASSVELRPCHN